MLRYFSYGHAAKIFLIKYKVVQASQKKQHTIPAEVLPNDSEALFGCLPNYNITYWGLADGCFIPR